MAHNNIVATRRRVAGGVMERIWGMDSFGIPMWLFGICALCSLVVGVGIRRWIERRKIREELEIKEKAKELRKQQKRYKKIARKAEKAGKNKKEKAAPSE